MQLIPLGMGVGWGGEAERSWGTKTTHETEQPGCFSCGPYESVRKGTQDVCFYPSLV